MWAIKTNLRISQLLQTIFIVAAAIGAESRTFIEEEPVYWYDTSESVYDEYVDIDLDLEILSPCELEGFPPGLNKSQQEVDMLRLKCAKEYHEMFLLPLTGFLGCGYKERENMPIDTGNKSVSVKLALLAGYGSIYSFSSINKDEDISKMKLGNVEREDLVKTVESKLLEVGAFEKFLGLPGLKNKYGGFTLRVVGRWWYKTHIDREFLEVIGVEDFRKAFGDVLLEQAENFDCSFDFRWENLKVRFSLPKMNRDLRVFHVNSFQLTENFENYICVLKYNGTQTVVWSKKQNCVVAKDEGIVSYYSKHNSKTTFSITSNSCMPMSNENTPYFAVSACYKRGMWKPEDFLNSKWIDETHYIYCNGGFINLPTLDDPPTPCPPFVFRTTYGFEIAEFMKVDFHFTAIPASISQTVNRLLFPGRGNTTPIILSKTPMCL